MKQKSSWREASVHHINEQEEIAKRVLMRLRSVGDYEFR